MIVEGLEFDFEVVTKKIFHDDYIRLEGTVDEVEIGRKYDSMKKL